MGLHNEETTTTTPETMKNSLFLLGFILLFSILSVPVSAGGLTRHGETSQIRKLLKNILAKMDSESANEKGNLVSAKKEVSRARSSLAKAEGKLDSEESDFNQHSSVSSSERLIITKILAMLSHDIGADASHPALSCKEVFETASAAKDGYYYVSQNGKVVRSYCARQEGRTVFSGSCDRDAKGSGWSVACLNKVEFNEAEQYLNVKSDGTIIIKRAGVYRITGKAIISSASHTSHHGRILINEKTWAYSHGSGIDATTEHVKLYYPFSKGQKIQVSWHAGGGGKRVKYFAADGGDGVNRVQVDYIGQVKDVALYSAGCGGHGRGGGWHVNCFNQVDFASA